MIQKHQASVFKLLDFENFPAPLHSTGSCTKRIASAMFATAWQLALLLTALLLQTKTAAINPEEEVIDLDISPS